MKKGTLSTVLYLSDRLCILLFKEMHRHFLTSLQGPTPHNGFLLNFQAHILYDLPYHVHLMKSWQVPPIVVPFLRL